jgi:hypothetical protein
MEIPVFVKGICPPICSGPRKISTSFDGSAFVKFIIDDEWWDALPNRTATFWAGPVMVNVPITDNEVLIPHSLYQIIFTPLRVCVCGTDCVPDPSDVARNKEIHSRKKAIMSQFAHSTGSELSALIDEYRALQEEEKTLTIIRRRFTTDWCEIGSFYPGIITP